MSSRIYLKVDSDYLRGTCENVVYHFHGTMQTIITSYLRPVISKCDSLTLSLSKKSPKCANIGWLDLFSYICIIILLDLYKRFPIVSMVLTIILGIYVHRLPTIMTQIMCKYSAAIIDIYFCYLDQISCQWYQSEPETQLYCCFLLRCCQEFANIATEITSTELSRVDKRKY